MNAYKSETLEEAADAALRQIEQKQYAKELEDHGLTAILKLGIAFSGKEACIKQL